MNTCNLVIESVQMFTYFLLGFEHFLVFSFSVAILFAAGLGIMSTFSGRSLLEGQMCDSKMWNFCTCVLDCLEIIWSSTCQNYLMDHAVSGNFGKQSLN